MSRLLRGVLLGSIAIAYLYLLIHAREPLRLNIGDPWSDANVLSSINYVKSDGFLATSFTDILDVGPLTEDSYRYTHYPPFAEIIYGAIGKFLGVSDIGTFRLFALVFSGLAMWLLFSYVRRLYSDRIALIATALASTSLMWMMYADSIHQAPVMTAMMFLALWGLVRAIETGQRRHYAAACLGSFGAFFTSYDCYLFLPVAVLVTVYLKAGNPFGRGKRHFVVLCAAGCALGIAVKCLTVIGAVGWHEFVADLRLQFLERATSTYDRKFQSSIVPTLVRRLTLVFTPFAWITAAVHALKAIRAPDWSSAIKNTAAWMLVAGLAFVALFPQLAASQMLPSQVFLPFYAIGSALLIDRLLDGSTALRRFAYVWLVGAPLWSFVILFTHPRSVLERDDVAKTTAYLEANDPNDFVMSNLMSAGHVQASFQRHEWSAPDAADTSESALDMIRLFEVTGTDVVHEIAIMGPDSRFIDKSLWPLAMPRRLWSITGWPHLNRKKTNAIVADYDKRVKKNLAAARAQKVLELTNYAVWRIDRATVMALLGEPVPITDHIDFGSLGAKKHLLVGWGAPDVVPGEQIAAVSIEGFERCLAERKPRGNACKTVLDKFGLQTKHIANVPTGLLMIRAERACDLRLTFTFATPSYVRFSVNGFSTTMAPSRTAAFTVPAANVTPGINVVELASQLPLGYPVHLATLDLAPACPAAAPPP
jgi:hypothetical protein